MILKQEDEQFIEQFVFGNNDKLPISVREKYKNNCKYLWFISRFTPAEVKTQLGFDRTDEFLDYIIAQISKENRQGVTSLPENKRKLRAKVQEYKQNGAICVIHKSFGNKNSVAIKDELQESILMTMIEHPNKLDDTVIAKKYNEWAKSLNYKEITSATVGNYRKRMRLYVSQSRDGRSQYYNTFGKVIHRTRPSEAMLMVNSDDNILDLFFRDGSNYYKRFALYVIIDAYNDYILGWAIGDTVTTELVKDAYRNAIAHIRELTGEYQIWHQLQTDRWNIKGLTPFYEAQGAYTPATQGNARAKVIERSFGTVWHQHLKMYKNYSGYNITAKEKRNSEAIELQKKSFPTVDEAYNQVEEFITSLRLLNGTKGTNKQQEWLQSFREKQTVIQLPDVKRLKLFGVAKTIKNKLTNAGIVFELRKQKYIYDVDQENYQKNDPRTLKRRLE